MLKIHLFQRIRRPSLSRGIPILLILALLGACGASDGEDRQQPALSSGQEGSETASEPGGPGVTTRESRGTRTSQGKPEAAAGATSAPSQERLPPPGEAWVIFSGDTVTAELARTPAEREQGLMYREDLPPGRGMLFVFQDAQYRSFWMRNTFIPLDIAYLDENLRIVDIQPMEPQTEDGHPSAQPAMFALEVPQGWFAAQGIGVGDQARLVFGPGG